MYLDPFFLPYPVRPVNCLLLDSRIPPPVKHYDVVGACKVEACSAGLE